MARGWDVSIMHVFGTTCFRYVQNTKELDAQSKDIFVGYDRDSPYLVYYLESNKVE